MYIEFRLPNGAGGMAAGHALHILRQEITTWAAKYDVEFKTKVVKYTMRLCFENPEIYTLFQVSWDPPHNVRVLDYILVEPMS